MNKFDIQSADKMFFVRHAYLSQRRKENLEPLVPNVEHSG